jgi:hypothetical protein
MKITLEHRLQKVASWPDFLARLACYTTFALGLIAVSLGIGIPGYHYFASLTWIDSFYMSSMILTGMGPVTDMPSEGAKIFSSVYALYSGIAFLSITGVFLSPIVHRVLHILQVEAKGNE